MTRIESFVAGKMIDQWAETFTEPNIDDQSGGQRGT